jgi:hypothetical protein
VPCLKVGQDDAHLRELLNERVIELAISFFIAQFFKIVSYFARFNVIDIVGGDDCRGKWRICIF